MQELRKLRKDQIKHQKQYDSWCHAIDGKCTIILKSKFASISVKQSCVASLQLHHNAKAK